MSMDYYIFLLKLVYIIYLAILTGDYLFILFGAVNVNNNTETFTLSQKIRAMDVNSYSWVSFVRGSTSETQSPTTDVDQNDETLNDSSVSAGTIAGAVVGGVAGLAIIAGITAFFLIRRRKSQKLEEEKNEFSSDRMLPDETDGKRLFIYMCSNTYLSLFRRIDRYLFFLKHVFFLH